MPEDMHHCKLLGLYPQRQDGLWMERIVILGGLLNGSQWSALARIARMLTPETPLHLTTRQDVELHNLTPDKVPAVHRELAAVGLSTLGGGGDTLRNITVCSCSGVATGVPDLLPLARRISDVLKGYANLYALPRKFKISLSACENACGQPWINDLGLVAIRRDGQWGFRVIAGGSLGSKPGVGMVCFDWLPAADVLPLALAAVRLFDAEGDREHRSQARLRHVRLRLGEAAFLERLRAELAKAREENGYRPRQTAAGSVPVFPPAPLSEKIVLTFPNGDVTPDAAEALGELASQPSTAVRIAANHRVLIFGRDEAAVRTVVEARPPLRAAMQSQPSVVACPGNRWCKRGLVDTNAMAGAIRQALGASLTGTVALSGCPNGCVHSAVADIGLVGQVVTVEGQRVEAFRLFHGGGMGRNDTLAKPLDVVPAAEVVGRLKELK